jgi:hypothetical protein
LKKEKEIIEYKGAIHPLGEAFRPLNPTFISSLLQDVLLYPPIPHWGIA